MRLFSGKTEILPFSPTSMFPLRRAAFGAFEFVEALFPENEERLFLVITGLDPLVPAVFDIPVPVFDVHFGNVFITRLCAPR